VRSPGTRKALLVNARRSAAMLVTMPILWPPWWNQLRFPAVEPSDYQRWILDPQGYEG
jgi:hypothetical protein